MTIRQYIANQLSRPSVVCFAAVFMHGCKLGREPSQRLGSTVIITKSVYNGLLLCILKRGSLRFSSEAVMVK